MTMYQTMIIHKFKKESGSVYLSPVYIRDDGKYKIHSEDRCIMGTLRRVYVVIDTSGKEIGCFNRLKDAKTVFEVEHE